MTEAGPGPAVASRGSTLGLRLALAFLSVALAAVALLAGLTATLAAADVSALTSQQRADLTPTEWGILGALATVPGRVYSRFELINRVRGYEFEGYERTIDSHVKNLRRKIEQDPGRPQIVQTVLGGGYRLGLTRDD